MYHLKHFLKVTIIIFCFFGLFFYLTLQTIAQEDKTSVNDETMKKVEQTAEKWVNFLLYRDQDTGYINNLSDQWAVRLLAVNKYNYFQLRDNLNKSSLRYRPEVGVNLGLGVSYKWFALDLTFDFGLRENKQLIDDKFFDFQGKVFTSKQLLSLTIQYYYGYYITKQSGISQTLSDIQKQRNDIRKINLGLQWLYAFNYERFSMKAPFVFNEMQRKSAGSIVTGVDLSLFVIDGDSIIVPASVLIDFDPQIHLTDLNVLNLALQVGYMYTFSIKKHFFITLGLIPGIVLNSGDYRTDFRQQMNLNVSWALNTMNAIGYNGNNFFCGLQFQGNIYNVRIAKKLSIDITKGNTKLILGYRFKQRKK